MLNLKRTQYTMILIVLIIFAASVILTSIAGINPQIALIDSALDSFQVNYNVIQFGVSSNPLILASKILDALIFPIVTVILAAWFFDFINNLDIREGIILSKLKRIEGHVIVAPYNNLGKAVLKELKNSGIKTVTIVENKKDLMQLYKENELVVYGDVREIETFETANIAKARGLVACSKDDIKNAMVAITAKTVNPQLIIISRAGNEEAIKGLQSAGAYKVLIPETSAGEDMGEEISRRVLSKSGVKSLNMPAP